MEYFIYTNTHTHSIAHNIYLSMEMQRAAEHWRERARACNGEEMFMNACVNLCDELAVCLNVELLVFGIGRQELIEY